MSSAASSRERLAACLAVATGRSSRAVLGPALAGADWKELLAVAERERVAPLIYRALKDERTVPEDVIRALRDSRRRTAVRVAQMRTGLRAVLAALHAAGIPVLLLKGAALSCDLWTDIGLRPWSDIDLFVDRSQVAGAIRALEPAGYTPGRQETTAGATVAHESELLLVGPDALVLDLHWSLFDSPHYQSLAGPSSLWARAQRVEIGNVPAWILVPELQLLHLCGHLVLHHGGDELLWLNDVAALIARYRDRIDWDLVRTEARNLDLVLPLQRVLASAAATLAAPVPPEVLDQVQALRPSIAERALVRRITDRHRSMAARLWLDLTSMGSWSERIAFARTRLFPSAAYMRSRYGLSHPLLVVLAYPYRWLIGMRRDPTGTDKGGAS